MKRTEILPLGYIINDSLRKVSEQQFEIVVLHKDEQTKIFVNPEEAEILFNQLADFYLSLPQRHRFAIEQRILAFVKQFLK